MQVQEAKPSVEGHDIGVKEETVIEKAFNDIMQKTQNFLDTQHLRNILMPSQSLPIGRVADTELQTYLKLDYFKRYYQEESAKLENLLLITNGASHSRPNPPQKSLRKVYDEQESVYELQNMYRFGESALPEVNPNRQGGLNRFGTAYCVYLHPQVYLMDEIRNIDDDPKRYLQQSLVFPMRENPYFSSKLFQVIAQDYRIEKGNFFPQEIRELLVNLSCYLYQNQHAVDSEKIGNVRFLRAFKVFVGSQKFKENLKDVDENQSRVTLNESYLQIIKLLFEGQSRKTSCLQYLRKVFTPILSKLQISQLKKKLGKGQEFEALQSKIRSLLSNAETQGEEEYYLNFILETEEQINAVAERNLPNQSQQYEVNPLSASMDNFAAFNDRSMQELHLAKLTNTNPNRNTTRAESDGMLQGFATFQIQDNLTKDFFRPISRVLSANLDHSLYADLEPLTSVYSEYQNENKRQSTEQSEAQQTVTDVPECDDLKQDLFNTNYLLHDIYAPERTAKQADAFPPSDAEQAEESKEVTLFYSWENSQIVTKTCIDLCRRILNRLYTTADQAPFDVRVMLKCVLCSIEGAFDSNTKIVSEKAVYLLADLLAGCWLNGGFRWQECFGMSKTLKEEFQIAAFVLQSTRLIFEHVFLLKELPTPAKTINGFIIEELNKFISSEKERVLQYYTKLVNVDVDALIAVPDPKHYQVNGYFLGDRELFEIALIRRKDLLQLIKLVKPKLLSDFVPVDLCAEYLLNVTGDEYRYEMFMKNFGNGLFRVHKSKPQPTSEESKRRIDEIAIQMEKIQYDREAGNIDEDDYAIRSDQVRRDIQRCRKQQQSKKSEFSFGDQLFEEQFIAFQAPIANFLLNIDNQLEKIERVEATQAIEQFVDKYFNPATAQRAATELVKSKQASARKQHQPKMPVISEDNESEISFCAQESSDDEAGKGSVKSARATGTSSSGFTVEERKGEPQDRPSRPSNYMENISTVAVQGNSQVKGIDDHSDMQFIKLSPGSREETKKPKDENRAGQRTDKQADLKKQYSEHVKRALHHLEQVFNMPQFTEERINDLKNPQGHERLIEINQLFAAVLEDDKQQADPCYNLQLDATLINRNYRKLDEAMKKNMLKLFADKMTAKIDKIQSKFEDQNRELGLLYAQLSIFDRTTQETIEYLKEIYEIVKFNRFVNRTLNSHKINKKKISIDRNSGEIGRAPSRDLSKASISFSLTNQASDSFINHVTEPRYSDLLQPRIEGQAQVAQSVTMPSGLGAELLEQSSLLDQSADQALRPRPESVAQTKVRDSEPIPTRQNAKQQNKQSDDETTIKLSTMMSNIIKLFTEFLIEPMKLEISNQKLNQVDTSLDYYSFQMCLDIFKKCTQSIVQQAQNKQQVEEEGINAETKDVFFDTFANRVKDLILTRIWNILIEQCGPSQSDIAIREHFQTKIEDYQPPMEEFEEMGFELEDFDEIYQTSIEYLLTINEVSTPAEKADVIERALEMAYKAHCSMSVELLSDQTKDRIVSFIIAKAYALYEEQSKVDENTPQLQLQMNVIFILMFGDRAPEVKDSVIKVKSALERILTGLEHVE